MDRTAALERGRRAPALRLDTDALAALVFALLVAGCFAAFFVTQRLKHTPTVVQRIMMYRAFAPTPSSARPLEHLSFRLANADEVTLEVINDANQATVATLLRDQPVGRYRQYRLRWNGHLGLFARGPLAPPGTYRLRFLLRRQHRTVYSPRTFRLVLNPSLAGN